MKLPGGEWLLLDAVESTQGVAIEMLAQGEHPTVILAANQTAGRGRFGRVWISEPGNSLAATIVFSEHADHPRPWLIGMAVAAATAGVLHCQVRWPNDLTIAGRKVGGILTDLGESPSGRVPVVGLGVNLGPISFPAELVEKATTLSAHRPLVPTGCELLRQVLDRLESVPEPDTWQDVEPLWQIFDDTPGKMYRLPDGQEAIAIGVAPGGELLAAVDGESTTVVAADALFEAKKESRP